MTGKQWGGNSETINKLCPLIFLCASTQYARWMAVTWTFPKYTLCRIILENVMKLRQGLSKLGIYWGPQGLHMYSGKCLQMCWELLLCSGLSRTSTVCCGLLRTSIVFCGLLTVCCGLLWLQEATQWGWKSRLARLSSSMARLSPLMVRV